MRVGERLGRPGVSRGEGPLVWLHGASVGEGMSLLPLASHIRELRPGLAILVTTGTRASADLLGPRLPEGVVHQFSPIDIPAAAQRFLSHWRPALGVFVESELWPNLIAASRASGTRLALVSAKISPASWRNWRRVPGAARTVLGSFDLILARDGEARLRIEALGGHVEGLWDAKLAAPALMAVEPELAGHRRQARYLRLIVAVSTHPGEEVLVARAFAASVKDAPNARLVIVPRHSDRGPEVERIVRAEGLVTARRRLGGDLTSAQAYVADTMGELGLWYRLATLAILGGSLTPGVGGHNPLEPARLGCPFVSGRHVEFWPIYQDLVEADATRLLTGPAQLAEIMGRAVRGDPNLADMAFRARMYVSRRDEESQALAPRLLALIDP
ncbi:MAG TPA: glycosyltransferase N-terminal domain-containing protein [Caulobacteraceae bacterium]